ncbi:MAG TPA: PAS domain-containing protein [Rhizomicrobium sp.]|jgi:hypothetical protein|nr:PAS domain-containing protein [Rhizomicrobium sp.]
MAVVLGHNVDSSHYLREHRYTPITEAVHPSTLQLIAYWRECETRGGMMMGRDVPARAIANLLRDVTVSEPVNDWADARIRLAGFGMAEHFGRDVSGMLMSDVFAGDPRDMKLMLDGSRWVIAQNQPGMIEHVILDKGREILRQEMTAVPLRAPDGDARWILVGTFNF